MAMAERISFIRIIYKCVTTRVIKIRFVHWPGCKQFKYKYDRSVRIFLKCALVDGISK